MVKLKVAVHLPLFLVLVKAIHILAILKQTNSTVMAFTHTRQVKIWSSMKVSLLMAS